MWTEEKLETLLTTPSQALVDELRDLRGDLMILGASGKMGPTLSLLAKNALCAAGSSARVYAVSRFTDPKALTRLQAGSVECIAGDLLEPGVLEALPEVPNIVYIAGRKFGTTEDAPATWAVNASLPTLVTRRYPNAKFVAFSTGNVYAPAPIFSGGSVETDAPQPLGEYGISCLARERIFERAAMQGARVLLYRLSYAVDLRYGVLCDLAQHILADEPISLNVPCFSCVWQGYANEVALRALADAASPAAVLNVTGPEQVSVRYAAEQLGIYLGKTPRFKDEPGDRASFSNSAHCMSRFGYPSVGLAKLIRWQAEWMLDGGRLLGKPTHFEEQGGRY
ncbi:epimerase [Clostridia bacterium]|nr:epimerase [Clostridia bacterium]